MIKGTVREIIQLQKITKMQLKSALAREFLSERQKKEKKKKIESKGRAEE